MTLTYFDAYTCFGPRTKAHPRQPWSLPHLLDELNHCSISAALVESTATTLYDGMFENRRLVQQLKPWPWLHPLWNVFPHYTGEMPEPDAFIDEMRRAGVRAVTLHPKTNDWPLIADLSAPLLSALETHQVPALLAFGAEAITVETLETLLKQYPRLPIILHDVYWSRARNIAALLMQHRNLHITFAHMQINYGLEWLVEKGCEDQLLFASNAPTMSAGAHRFYVDYADLPVPIKQKIAGGNLVRLLGDLKPPPPRVNANADEIMLEAQQGKPLSPLVIDMHAHILDEGLNGVGAGTMMQRGGPKGTVELARRMGVDAIGIMSWNGTVGMHADQGNECVKAALDAYPDFFWGLGTFDPLHDSADEMLAKMKALYADKRFLGLKPYVTYGIPYDDARYDVWWQFGNERKMYCALHPVKWYKPDEFDSICKRFPDLTVIAYHCGASYEVADTVIALAKKYPNFYAEITLTPVCCGIVDYLANGCGPDRVLYGSDLPMRDPRQQLGWVVHSRLPVEQKKMIMGGNAQRILNHVRSHQNT